MIAGIVRAAVIFYNNKGGGRELEEQTTAQKERKGFGFLYYLLFSRFQL